MRTEPVRSADLRAVAVAPSTAVDQPTATVAQDGPVAVVVPDVRSAAPVEVSGGAMSAAGVHRDGAPRTQGEPREAVDVPRRVPESPAPQLPGVRAVVLDRDPFPVEARIAAGVRAGAVVADPSDPDRSHPVARRGGRRRRPDTQRENGGECGDDELAHVPP